MIEKSVRLIQIHKHWFVFAGLLLVTFLLYWPTLHVGFLSDDFDMLTITIAQHNPFHFFLTNLIGTQIGSSYGPVYNIFFWIEYHLFGLHAIFYHVIELFVASLVALCVFLLVREITNRDIIAIASAFLFLVLPNHTSAMAWVAVLPHVLASLFFLYALYSYVRYVRTRQRSWFVVATVAGVLALLVKEIAVTIFLLFALTELFFGKELVNPKEFILRNLRRFGLFFILFLAYFFSRNVTTGEAAGFYASSGGIDIVHMWHMLVEIITSMFVSYPARALWTTTIVTHPITYGLLVVFILSIFVFYAKSYRKSFSYFLLCFLIVSIPFLQVWFDPLSNGGERYAYLLSAFFIPLGFIILFSLVSHFRSRNTIFLIIVLLIIIFVLPTTQYQIQTWSIGGRVVHDAFASVEPTFISPNEYVLFVGLPNELDGVPLFENATADAIHVYHHVFFFSTRILLATILDRTNYNQDIVSIKHPDSLTYVLVPTNQTHPVKFTGFHSWKHPYATFILNNFVTSTNSGNSITIHINKKKLDGLHAEGRGLALVYFTNGRFQKISVTGK